MLSVVIELYRSIQLIEILLALIALLFHWVLDLLDILPNVFRALLDQLRRILANHNARVIDHAFKDMEEVHEILVLSYGLILPLKWLLRKQLGPYILKSLNINVDSSYRFIHLNNLFKHMIFLPLFHESQYFLAVDHEVLLSLHL